MDTYLAGTQFEIDLAEALGKFLPRHMELCLAKPELKFDEYGTDTEKKLKLIWKFYGNIRVVFRDIDLTLKFLERERSNILRDYPFLKSQETYYTYHYENYVIRATTILDVIGKLGALIYGLELDFAKVSAHTFKDKARREGYKEISKITEKIIAKLVDIKLKRNDKLHTGEADISLFQGTVIWEDLNAIIGYETTAVLQEHTDLEITKEISMLKNSTIELIDLIKEFLKESHIKLSPTTTNDNYA
jgi:hypothetical protein